MSTSQTARQKLCRELLETLTKLGRKLRTVFNARVTEHGLTYPRARTLLCLLERPPLTQKELAGELEVEQPTIGRLLDRMEELNLIVRLDVPEDRRAKHVALTPYGEEQAKLVAWMGQELRDEMFARIPEYQLHQAVAVVNDLESGTAGMIERAATSGRRGEPS